ncbi:MAG TPA: AAA family ATPase, partial [Candidatus Limnocylindria bacterium]
KDAYAAVAATREPRLLSIFGDAGVGKTRLMRELWDWLAEQTPQPIHLIGRVLSYGKGATYWPLGQVLKQHFGIPEGESGEATAAKLADHPYLALTLGISSDAELHPLVARERLQDAWVDFLGGLARDRPVVLLIEDAHWAEDQLCDLIDTLVAQVAGPLLVLVTARHELLDRRPAWGGTRERASALRLDALPANDTAEMLAALLGVEAPDQIRTLVVERAEGNPFFIEELIATFVDRGVLQRQNGSWTFGQLPAGFSVPDSVQAVLAARIDLLPDAEKQGLQAASVIGRTFWTGPMYELVGAERPDIGILEDREFVRRRPTSTLPGEREYLIKHALTREVAYESLPRARRAQLHADFAAWLDRRMEGRDELAPFLAHHYATAVRPEDLDLAWAGREAEVEQLRAKALTWLRKAAELAIGRYEIDDGITLLRRAVELETETDREADLWFQIGRASALKYDGHGLVAAMDRALELGAPPGEVYSELAYQWAMRAGMFATRLDDALTEGWLQRGLAESPPGTTFRARALVARAQVHDDLDAARDALALAEELGDPLIRIDALGAQQGTLQIQGRFDEAAAIAAVRIELVPEVADPDRAAEVFYTATLLYIAAGRLADATEAAARMEETVAGLTPHHRMHGMGIRMLLQSAMADWAAIRALTRRTEELITANLATPCPYNRVTLLLLATAWTYGGDAAEASRALDRAEEVGMASYVHINSAHMLRLAIARKDRGEIRRVLDLIEPEWLDPWAPDLVSARFDGLIAVGDRDRIEADAPRWLDSGGFIAPFAMRALAVIRSDQSLLADAAIAFETMGLPLRAEETRAMVDRLGSHPSP